MNAVAAPIDTAQLSALCERLGIAPQQLLIAAARWAAAEPELQHDPDYLRRVLDDARRADPAAESAARLLLTPVADYAINDLDRLFASIWPTAGDQQGA